MKPLSRLFHGSLFNGCKRLFAMLFATLVVAISAAAFAGEGHDHGESKTPAGAAPASPRFQGHSDLFEVVGTLKRDGLSITIDRYATNEPVLNATVEVEVGNVKRIAKFHPEHGDYSLPAESFRKPGTYAITLSVVAGKEADLLAGDMVVPDPQAGHDPSAQAAAGLLKWAKPAGAAALVLAGLAMAVAVWRRRRVRV